MVGDDEDTDKPGEDGPGNDPVAEAAEAVKDLAAFEAQVMENTAEMKKAKKALDDTLDACAPIIAVLTNDDPSGFGESAPDYAASNLASCVDECADAMKAATDKLAAVVEELPAAMAAHEAEQEAEKAADDGKATDEKEDDA